MKDANGAEVRVGSRIVVLSGGLEGRFGTVWKISTYPGRKSIPAVRASDAPDESLKAHQSDACTWMSWLMEDEFVVVPDIAATARP